MARIRRWLGGERGKFVRDTGNVVLGVLIALGIGELADDWRWRIKVDDTTRAVGAEMAGNRWNYVERRLLQPCIARRLATLGGVLADAHRTHRLPAIDGIGQLPRRLYEHAAFDIAKSEGVSLHMDAARWRRLAQQAGVGDAYEEANRAEAAGWAVLSAMQGPARAVDPTLLTALDLAYAQLRAQTRFVGLVAAQGDRSLAALGIPIEFDADLPQRDRTVAAMAARYRASPICRPLPVDGQPFAAPVASTATANGG